VPAASPIAAPAITVATPIVPVVVMAMVGGAETITPRPAPGSGGVVLDAELPIAAGLVWPGVTAFAAALVDGRVVEDGVEVDEDAVKGAVTPLLRRRTLRQVLATLRRPPVVPPTVGWQAAVRRRRTTLLGLTSALLPWAARVLSWFWRHARYLPRMGLGRHTPIQVWLLWVRRLAPVPVREWMVAAWTLVAIVNAWALLPSVAPRRGPPHVCEVMLQHWQPQRLSCRGKVALRIRVPLLRGYPAVPPMRAGRAACLWARPRRQDVGWHARLMRARAAHPCPWMTRPTCRMHMRTWGYRPMVMQRPRSARPCRPVQPVLRRP
jgi:hypothetical protein